MKFGIRSGRLRHVVDVYRDDNSTNEYGEPIGSVLLFPRRCEVQEKSGDQLENYGTVLTSRIITVLMWFDAAITNDCVLEWRGVRFNVKHIRPDTMGREMIVTAEVETK